MSILGLIEREECPVHGIDYGRPSITESGKRWCQRCRMPANELVTVEYVSADQLKGAVEALRGCRRDRRGAQWGGD